jgi:hypothetical protein
MKSYIRYLGVFDNAGHCHYIDFNPGVNIITGRSSTGKSALIEIFDYCFGNGNNTIPDGVITENANRYFVVINIKDTNLIIARNQAEKINYVFYKIDPDLDSIDTLTPEYFSDDYLLPIKTFKEGIGRFLGIDISDADENIDNNNFHNYVKKGHPSIRNMVPFMLQHQNLIANKHSLFYRFDEKEKRERTIEEFKIFCGFVNQDYFLLKQRLKELELKYEREARNASHYEEDKKLREVELEDLLNEYLITTGNNLLDNIFAQQVLDSPQQYIDELNQHSISTNDESDKYKEEYNRLTAEKNKLISERRTVSLKLEQIKSSIDYVKKYAETIDNIKPVSEAMIDKSTCPFCRQPNNHNNHINKLKGAIDWLNSELIKVPSMIDSFAPEKQECEKQIIAINGCIKMVNDKINAILKINKQLEADKSLEEQGLKIKLSIENLLEWSLKGKNKVLEADIEDLQRQIGEIKQTLTTQYNVEGELKKAEAFINSSMNKIGNNLDFEKSYQPINLHFDIEKFELYHQKSDGKKTYLRSMGSGANWLYSHVCLFLSLQRYFCSLKDKCIVPSILFLDQPSQVYFPATIDIYKEGFNAEKLKQLEDKSSETDDDLKSVTKLFDEIIKLINEILEEYDIEPQVIISDHADNLKISGGDFEDFVRRRWRKENEGLIDLGFINNSHKE